MWKNKKLLLSIGMLSVTLIMLVVQGCGQSEDNNDQTEIENQGEEDDTQASAETMISENRERMLSRMNLDKVAEILDIDLQEVEDAFIQAQEEVFGTDLFSNREGWTQPEELPSDRIPSEGPPEERPESMILPDGTEFPGGMSRRGNIELPESLIARMAEILNIDQETLNDAFKQARSTDFE